MSEWEGYPSAHQQGYFAPEDINHDEIGYLHERLDALCRQVATDLGAIIAHAQTGRPYTGNARAYTRMAQNRLQLAQDAAAEKFGRETRDIFKRRSRGR